MKKLIASILLLTAACAFGQYRYQPYTLADSGTNSTIAANTNITYEAGAAVASGNYVQIQLAFKLTTNHVAGTNPITCTFEKSMDGTRWDGSFTYGVAATTNAEAWGRTNVSVADSAYIRLKSLTNGNAWSATNLTVKVGQKIGL